MLAPIACRPLTCWSTGRCPMAQPPGSDTRAWPVRASSGPSTSTEARMVFTISYGASGLSSFAARSSTVSSLLETCTPICDSSFAMVRTSIRRGTFASLSVRSVSSAAHRIGRAAFFAPETRISPSRVRPPVIFSLSTGLLPFLGGQGLHGKRMDLLAHAVAQRGVHQLVTLHAALAGERRRDDDRLEMLPVADHLEVLAREAGRDAGFDAFRVDHQCLSL